MKAWRALENGRLELQDLPTPRPAAGGVVLRMQAASMLSYLRQVLDGSLGYDTPPRPFTPGTNGIGIVEAVGAGVYHLSPGQRVTLDPHLVANEPVAEPAQILIGLTGMRRSSEASRPHGPTKALQASWPDGTYAEMVHMPAAVATPLPAALDALPAAKLAAIAKFLVPYGGLLRMNLQAGETIVVNGATGYFGGAGALLALALGAGRVVAAGRDAKALDDLAGAAGPRLAPVALTGDVEALRAAAGRGADCALDLVGRAESADATLAALRSLRRGGRLALMGSVSQPLPLTVGEMLGQDWTVMGVFMYPRDAPARLARLIASGQLDLGLIRERAFPLADIEAAMNAAARMRSRDLTVLTMD
ncbi:MAG TPA: zinc-binding alcohol dehydrogenase family protein [Roseiarcus sp.]|nr:zinc-binding alcohol dehydrogenase family protein [Roseiarcus sp.]